MNRLFVDVCFSRYAVIHALRMQLNNMKKEMARMRAVEGDTITRSLEEDQLLRMEGWKEVASTDMLVDVLVGRLRGTEDGAGRLHLLAHRESHKEESRRAAAYAVELIDDGRGNGDGGDEDGNSGGDVAASTDDDGEGKRTNTLGKDQSSGDDDDGEAETGGEQSVGAPATAAKQVSRSDTRPKLIVDGTLSQCAEAMAMAFVAALARRGAVNLVAITTVASPSIASATSASSASPVAPGSARPHPNTDLGLQEETVDRNASLFAEGKPAEFDDSVDEGGEGSTNGVDGGADGEDALPTSDDGNEDDENKCTQRDNNREARDYEIRKTHDAETAAVIAPADPGLSFGLCAKLLDGFGLTRSVGNGVVGTCGAGKMYESRSSSPRRGRTDRLSFDDGNESGMSAIHDASMASIVSQLAKDGSEEERGEDDGVRCEDGDGQGAGDSYYGNEGDRENGLDGNCPSSAEGTVNGLAEGEGKDPTETAGTTGSIEAEGATTNPIAVEVILGVQTSDRDARFMPEARELSRLRGLKAAVEMGIHGFGGGAGDRGGRGQAKGQREASYDWRRVLGSMQSMPQIIGYLDEIQYEQAPESYEVIIEQLLRWPNQITLVCLGSPDNLADANARCPGILLLAREIVLLAGDNGGHGVSHGSLRGSGRSKSGGNGTNGHRPSSSSSSSSSSASLLSSPAVRTVLSCGHPRILVVPRDVGNQFRMTRDMVDSIVYRGDVKPAWWGDASGREGGEDGGHGGRSGGALSVEAEQNTITCALARYMWRLAVSNVRSYRQGGASVPVPGVVCILHVCCAHVVSWNRVAVAIRGGGGDGGGGDGGSGDGGSGNGADTSGGEVEISTDVDDAVAMCGFQQGETEIGVIRKSSAFIALQDGTDYDAGTVSKDGVGSTSLRVGWEEYECDAGMRIEGCTVVGLDVLVTAVHVNADVASNTVLTYVALCVLHLITVASISWCFGRAYLCTYFSILAGRVAYASPSLMATTASSSKQWTARRTLAWPVSQLWLLRMQQYRAVLVVRRTTRAWGGWGARRRKWRKQARRMP